MEESFTNLKAMFSSAPILTIPDPHLQFIVEVDAANEGIGVVLVASHGENCREVCGRLSNLRS